MSDSDVNLNQFHLFGLNFNSELPFADQMPVTGDIDVNIHYGKLPEHLNGCTAIESGFQVAPGKVLFNIDGVGRVAVCHGKKIIIDPFKGISEGEISQALLSSVMGALLHQRGFFPFHGSAVEIGNESILFTGSSGSGKSTTAALFYTKGYRLLAEDLCNLSVKNGNEVLVEPGLAHCKLTDNTVNLCNIELPEGKPQLHGKNLLPLHGGYCDEPRRLSRIYSLVASAEAEKVEIFPMKGSKKLNVVRSNTYRNRVRKHMGSNATHLQRCAAIAGGLVIKKLVRPTGYFPPQLIVDAVLKDMETPLLSTQEDRAGSV